MTYPARDEYVAHRYGDQKSLITGSRDRLKPHAALPARSESMQWECTELVVTYEETEEIIITEE